MNSDVIQEKKSILFVDDEVNVLNGLKRMLRSMRSEWDMFFAIGGQEALDFLEKKGVDVIVSDMRMPEIDGAALLKEVSKKYPDVIRIVLSGQAEKEDIFRSIGPSHQYLSKPCDSEKLKTIVKRSFALRDTLKSDKLKEVVSKIKKLPSQPHVYNELVEALKNDNIAIKHIGSIISKDVAMTAQILKLVNSSYFGFRSNITDPGQAVSYLGLDLVKSLMLSIDLFEQEDCKIISSEKIWKHSWDTAILSREIAMSMNMPDDVVNQSFTAGMLHECGLIILANNFPDEYEEYLYAIENNEKNIVELETKIFGATHEEVGAYLLGIWGLPDGIVEAVSFHSSPFKSFSDEFTAMTALHLADAIDYHLKRKEHPWFSSKMNRKYVDYIGLTEKIPNFINMHKDVLAKNSVSNHER